MALHVALNRTPASDKKCECHCEEEADFTLNDLLEIQEKQEEINKDLKDVKCKINSIMRECAYIAGMRSVTLLFTSDGVRMADSLTHKHIVVKNFTSQDLDSIGAWMRNNGFSVEIHWNKGNHGMVLGSIFVYW